MRDAQPPPVRSVAFTYPGLVTHLGSQELRTTLTARDPGTYVARVRHSSSDGVEVTEVVASPHETCRSWAQIDPDVPPRLVLALILAGSGYVHQRSRTATLGVGDLAIYETHTPFRAGFLEDSRALVISLPADSLDLTRDDVTNIAAVTISGKSGVGALVVPFLSQLAPNLDLLTTQVGPRTAMSVHHLIGTLIGANLLQRSHGRPRSELLFRDVCAWIERHLGDTTLSPDAIAAEFYISRRRLYSMFQDRETSVVGWMKARRLTLCAQDLRDPIQAHLTVAEIGRRYGFPDPAHFSRSFKVRYGEAPSQYRDSALAGPTSYSALAEPA